jgi:hypothetical protein
MNTTNSGTPEALTVSGITATGGTSDILATLHLPCAFKVYRNGAFTDGGSTPSTIPYDTKVFDLANNVSLSTGIFTCTVAGIYVFSAGTWRNGKAGGTTYLNQNGSIVVTGSFTDSAGNNSMSVIPPVPLQLAVNDTIDVRSGGESTPRSLSTSRSSCYFGGYLLGHS